MIIYSVEGKEEDRLSFIKNLSKDLSEDKKCLLISLKRNSNLNIEDIYDMEGMITYDICDYFQDYLSLSDVINEADDNIDFIISPLLEDKYDIKKEDLNKLIKDLSSYDYLIFDNLGKNYIENVKSIKIINNDEVDNEIDTYYFYIEADNNFDQRTKREEILGKSSKFLGLRKENEPYKEIINNLKNDNKADIEKLSLIEKIKMKFIK